MLLVCFMATLECPKRFGGRQHTERKNNTGNSFPLRPRKPSGSSLQGLSGKGDKR